MLGPESTEWCTPPAPPAGEPKSPGKDPAASKRDEDSLPVVPTLAQGEAVEPGDAWTLIPDEELTTLTDEQVYGWIGRLVDGYGIKAPKNYDLAPIESLREWVQEAARSEEVRARHERQEQERLNRVAYPKILDYVEVPIQGATTLRITPYAGGWGVSVWNSNLKRQIYRSGHKTPPWLSDKIQADTGATIATEMARAGLGAEEDIKGWLRGAWEALHTQIRDTLTADLAVQSPVVKKALTNLVEVRIVRGETTLTEVIYAADGTRASLEFDAAAYTGTAANLNTRWYNAFAPDELNASKNDWAQIKRFWGEVAEITETEEYCTWDGIVERLQDHLKGLHYGRELRDLLVSGFAWYNAHGAYLDEPRKGGVLWVPSSTVQEFVDALSGEVRSVNALAKELRDRGIMLEKTKPLKECFDGEVAQRRAWPFNPGFLNYRPEWADGGGEDRE